MEVKVGVKGVARELVIETDLSSDEVAAIVQSCSSDAAAVFDLADARGRRVLVPAEKLAYVDIGEQEARRVGFGAM